MASFNEFYASASVEEKQMMTLLALIPPPISIDQVVNVGPGNALTSLKLLEKLRDYGLLAIHNELGAGYYLFPDLSVPSKIINKSPKKEVQETAQNLISFYEDSIDKGPKRWLGIAHVINQSGVGYSDVKPFLESVLYYLDSGAREAAFICFKEAHSRIRINHRQEDARQLYLQVALRVLFELEDLVPFRDQESVLEVAQGIAQKLEDWFALAKLNSISGRIAYTQANYSQASKLLTKGQQLAEKFGDKALRKEIALSMSELLFRQGYVNKAIESYESTIGNLEEYPSDPSTLRSCARLGWIYAISGQVARGIGLIEVVNEKAKRLSLAEVSVYSELMKALTLLEACRIEDAEPILRTLLRKQKKHTWAVNLAMAYIRYKHDDLKGCIRFQKTGYESRRKLRSFHHRGPWNFEYMQALEEAGLEHKDMNCENEIRRLLQDPDIYMKGVALRVRALRNQKQGIDERQVIEDLEKSENLLTRAGAKLELAYTRIALARIYDSMGRTRKADLRLRSAWEVLSSVNESLFPLDLLHRVAYRDREELLISTVVEVGNALAVVRDKGELPKRIIDLMLNLTKAERGGFFLTTSRDEPKLAASRNLDEATTASAKFKANKDIISRVAQTGKEQLYGFTSRSRKTVSEGHPVSWTVYAPMMLRDHVLGVLYLEGGHSGYAPSTADLKLLKAIGSQVAMAVDHARAYERIADLRDRLRDEVHFLAGELKSVSHMHGILGESSAIRQVFDDIRRVCATESSVLIIGETGVGKELVARNIHRLSPRSEGPFIPANIASLSEELIASELFGHERGAFTGAVTVKRGRFELAIGGTLFLDDIQNLSLSIQAKLLRVLEEREFERVGGTKTIKANFRLIAATNTDLEVMVNQKAFRSDLYYRMKVFPIEIPPLRDRREDIVPLAEHFVKIFAERCGKEIKGISQRNIELLMQYNWPGNVRELQHLIERAVILCEGDFIRSPIINTSATKSTAFTSRAILPLKEMENQHILTALKKCSWKVSGKDGAARLLGLKPPTLYSKIRRQGIKKSISYSPDTPAHT